MSILTDIDNWFAREPKTDDELIDICSVGKENTKIVTVKILEQICLMNVSGYVKLSWNLAKVQFIEKSMCESFIQAGHHNERY